MTTTLERADSAQGFDKTVELKVAMDDALEGYRTMLEKAEPSFEPTVTTLIEQHRAARDDLETLLRERGAGAAAARDGSLMGAVHKTVVTLRAVVDDPDADWIPGIVDGERRNLDKFDAALAEGASDPALQSVLRKHRDALQRQVEALETRRPA
jgi:hypothetical protein